VSRTFKHQKDSGYEYWGKRYGNKGGQDCGEEAKRITNRAERRRAKQKSKFLRGEED